MWTKGDLILGIGLMVLTFGVVVVVLAILQPKGLVAGIIGTVSFEGAMAAIVLGLAWRRGLSLRRLGFVAPSSWTSVLGAWFGSYGIMFGYGLVLVFLRSIDLDTSRFEGGNPLPVRPGTSPALLAALGFMVVVVAPFCEELYFRAFLFRAFRGFARLLTAALLSGLAFALFHVNLAVILPFALIGALFAWSMERSGSLWTSIVAHFLVNSLSFAVSVSGVAPTE